MAITIDLEPSDMPATETRPQLYFVMIRGVPGSGGALVPHQALPLERAQRLQHRIIAAFVAYDGPEVPQGDRTLWDHLEGEGDDY